MTTPCSGAISVQDVRNEYYGGGGPSDRFALGQSVLGKPWGSVTTLSEFYCRTSVSPIVAEIVFQASLRFNNYPCQVQWNLATGECYMNAAGFDTGMYYFIPGPMIPIPVSILNAYSSFTHDSYMLSGAYDLYFAGALQNPAAANGWWGVSAYGKGVEGPRDGVFNIRLWGAV